MPRSERFDCLSPSGRTYRIFVAWPGGEPPAAGFPVIYLLDANAAFGTMVEAVLMQSRHPQATGVEPAVVVGIGYPVEEPFDIARRTYDLTPPVPAGRPVPIEEGAGGRPTGGAPEFLGFIAGHVMPLVERRFAVDPTRRTIFGHSFGGLFVLHCLFSRPDLFSTFVAASPSIWWRDAAILEEERGFAPQAGSRKRLMVTVGALEQAAELAGAAGPSAPDRSSRRMVDNARELAERLGALAPDRLAVHFSLFADETHASSLPVAIGRALRMMGTGALR